jgi:hypothetical protein
MRSVSGDAGLLGRGGWRDKEANLIFNWIASGSLLPLLFGQQRENSLPLVPRHGVLRKFAFAVAIGNKADMPFCTAN